jgi:hypothetical protein
VSASEWRSEMPRRSRTGSRTAQMRTIVALTRLSGRASAWACDENDEEPSEPAAHDGLASRSASACDTEPPCPAPPCVIETGSSPLGNPVFGRMHTLQNAEHLVLRATRASGKRSTEWSGSTASPFPGNDPDGQSNPP